MRQTAAGDLSSAGRSGASLIGFWDGCLRLLTVAFGHSFFWTSATAIYLLLRRDADATEIDEVFVTGREDERGLPPLKTDPAGVAVLTDEGASGAVAPPDSGDSASDLKTGALSDEGPTSS
jgi:hypothetical protein